MDVYKEKILKYHDEYQQKHHKAIDLHNWVLSNYPTHWRTPIRMAMMSYFRAKTYFLANPVEVMTREQQLFLFYLDEDFDFWEARRGELALTGIVTPISQCVEIYNSLLYTNVYFQHPFYRALETFSIETLDDYLKHISLVGNWNFENTQKIPLVTKRRPLPDCKEEYHWIFKHVRDDSWLSRHEERMICTCVENMIFSKFGTKRQERLIRNFIKLSLAHDCVVDVFQRFTARDSTMTLEELESRIYNLSIDYGKDNVTRRCCDWKTILSKLRPNRRK